MTNSYRVIQNLVCLDSEREVRTDKENFEERE